MCLVYLQFPIVLLIGVAMLFLTLLLPTSKPLPYQCMQKGINDRAKV
jgi:hypothetical protein